MKPRAHVFASLQPPRDATRDLRPFQLRDLAAGLEVLGALQGYDYEIGEILLNHPPPGPPRANANMLAMSLGRVRAGDLIVTVTRPPLDDIEHGDPKQVRRGWTELEARLLDEWRVYFKTLARSYLCLNEPVAEQLPPRYRNRRDILFRTREGAYYKRLNPRDGSPARYQRAEPRTAVFQLRRSELWPGGPGYLGLFGMDGTSTLLWAWQLRHALPELLGVDGFTMMELCNGSLPERPTDLDWIGGWSVDPILVGCD